MPNPLNNREHSPDPLQRYLDHHARQLGENRLFHLNNLRDETYECWLLAQEIFGNEAKPEHALQLLAWYMTKLNDPAN